MIERGTKLTPEIIRGMMHREVITWGEDDKIPGVEGVKMRWVAVAIGGMWEIKYSYPERDGYWIILHGNKLGMPAEIRRLVPCSDEAFELYKF